MRKTLLTLGTVLVILTIACLLGFVWTEESKFGWTAFVLGFASIGTFLAAAEG